MILGPIGQKMLSIFKKFEKWFDLNCGWFFVNGRKTEQFQEYLKTKYGVDHNQQNKS